MVVVKQKSLIVEDDLDEVDISNAYFRVHGYKIYTINWGGDSSRVCQVSRPDSVNLDVCLPEKDGYEVARRLRNNRRRSDMPIIFLTEKCDRFGRL